MKTYLVFLYLLLIKVAAFPCECKELSPVTKEIAARYDVVFYGKVDSIKPCSKDGIGTVYFTVNKLYKGRAEQHVSVDYDCVSSCMMSFVKGEEWIIYSFYQSFDLLTVNFCSHSRKKIIDGSTDFYLVTSHRSFDEENTFLETIFGTQAFLSHQAINDQQKELQPHNEQPSAWGKLWLLLISLAVMGTIYFITKKYFRNDK